MQILIIMDSKWWNEEESLKCTWHPGNDPPSMTFKSWMIKVIWKNILYSPILSCVLHVHLVEHVGYFISECELCICNIQDTIKNKWLSKLWFGCNTFYGSYLHVMVLLHSGSKWKPFLISYEYIQLTRDLR